MPKILTTNTMSVIKPWSDDEIILRINMLRTAVGRLRDTDDMNHIMLEREILTWEELIKRRKEGMRIVT